MSYAAAIEQLMSLVPELVTQPGLARRKFSLDEIGVLLAALGNPQRRFKSVLIAGTNGKGSTAATLAAILQAADSQASAVSDSHPCRKERGKDGAPVLLEPADKNQNRVGLYTSPHLERVNERVRVSGNQIGNQTLAPISDDDFARQYFRVHDCAQQLVLTGKLAQMPSFFETLTALAFLHFAESGVEIAVLEVGMGGRLDATNIVDPLLSIVTDISLDHTEWLGATIAAIAREKAGILRRDGTLVTLPQHPEANQTLGEVAVALNVRGVNAAAYMPTMNVTANEPYAIEVLGEQIVIDSPLIGAHQQRNIVLAVAAAVELAGQVEPLTGFNITPASIARGVHTTVWPGRLERFKDRAGREWVLDVAHNPAGAWALRAGLNALQSTTSLSSTQQTLIFSCLRDKPLSEMAQILFPLFDRVIVAPIHSQRAISTAELLAAAEATGTPATVATSAAEAIELAQTTAATGRVVISGSVYLVGEARALLQSSHRLNQGESRV